MGNVLITCTRPRADDFANDLNNESIQSRVCPALIVDMLTNPMPQGNFDAVLITSRHAVIDNLPDLPIISVGDQTISNHNYNVIQTGAGGVNNLNFSDYKNILYPCSADPSFIPENATKWPVYKTTSNPDFYINNDEAIITVFSIRAAKIIAKHDLSGKTVICLSDAIATQFENSDMHKLAVCTRPRYHVMKSLIINEIEGHT